MSPAAGADDDVDLRRYVRDLVALSALPAMWVGQSRQTIVTTLADALLGTLMADFVYARLESADGIEPPVETCRVPGPRPPPDAREIGRRLESVTESADRSRARTVPDPLDDRPAEQAADIDVAVMPIGRAGTSLGVIIAGVGRPDFPSRYDLLLLNVVANHAAVTVQSAQLRQAHDQIAEQRRTAAILRQSEQRFRALIEHSSDIITLHQRDRRMTYVSPSAERILGYVPLDLIGEASSDAVHPDDTARVSAIWRQLIDKPGGVYGFRYRLRHADGSWCWMEATGTNLLNDPAVGAVVINRRDVTAEVTAQQILERRVVERTQHLESLFRADETLYRSLHVDDVLQALVDVAFEVLGVDKAAVLVRDEVGERLVVRTARGFDPAVLPHLSVSLHEGVSGLVYQSLEAIGVADYPAHPRAVQRLLQLLHALGVRAQMSVPIQARGEIFAVFNVYYSTRHDFTLEERRLLIALARRAGLAIENARLYEAASAVAALEERQRLARELHDSVSQALYAIALNAAAAQQIVETDTTKARGILDDVMDLAEAGLAEMRALIFELRPESIETEGLVVAIEKQVAAVRARHHLAVTTSAGAEPDVPLATKFAAYRVVQEALQNVARHARARSVSVVLDERPGELVVRIADDGQGFDTSASFPGHLGLKSMGERATSLGGEFEIASQPGQGTSIVVRLPT
jgi:PAS domain S-box-containing protein